MPTKELTWPEVPDEVLRLVKLARARAAGLRRALVTLQRTHPADPGYGKLWLNPETSAVFFSLGDGDSRDTYQAWEKRLRAAGASSVKGDAEANPSQKTGPWIRIKSAETAVEDVLGPPADVLGLRAGPMNAHWGGPRPVSTALAGGAIGAGAGYGAGWLAESMLPEHLQRRRLRKTLAVLGGITGAMPGAYQAYDNATQGKSVLDSWPPPHDPSRDSPPILEQMEDALRRNLNQPKTAEELPSAMAAGFDPYVDRNALHEIIWRDGGISQQLAATTDALMAAASEVRSPGTRFISPYDIGRITAGMGTGLASGMLVGKTLGALTGLSPSAQRAIEQSGVLAGLLANVVPMAFGR